MTNTFTGITPEELCNQCLQGVHGEIHKELGMMKSENVHPNTTLGHVKLGQFGLQNLQKRHKNIEKEAQHRGINCDSKINIEWTEPYILDLYVAPFPYKTANRIRKAHNCIKCRARMMRGYQKQRY